MAPPTSRCKVKVKVTERDVGLFVWMVEAGGFLGLDDLAVAFPSRKKAHGRLALLVRTGYLRKADDAGNGDLHYGLTMQSARIAAAHIGCSLSDMRWSPRQRRAFHMRHSIEVARIRWALEKVCEENDRFRCRILPGSRRSECLPGQQGQNGKRLCVPDLAFSLHDRQVGDSILRLVEIDIGTEPVTSSVGVGDISGKAKWYVGYYDQELYKRDYCKVFEQDFNGFVVLLLTTSPARLRHMAKAIRSEGAGDIFWLSTLEAAATGIFGRIWESALGDTSERLSLIGSRLQDTKSCRS